MDIRSKEVVRVRGSWEVVASKFVGKDMSYLEAEDLRLNELQRTTVDLDEALASLQNTKSQHFCFPNSGGLPSHHDRPHLPSPEPRAPRTLHWATAVAVFFLPKHCTRWGVDDMMGSLVDLTEGADCRVGVSRVVVVAVRCLSSRNPPRLAERIHDFLGKGLCPRRAPFLIGWG